MGSSWGHAVRRLTEDETARYVKHGWACASGKCREPATHFTEYSYVTGRSGRTSFSTRRACTVHAERFAAKHEIEITDAPRPVHASETAAGQALSRPFAAGMGELTCARRSPLDGKQQGRHE
jgi:hypothetical protein